MTNMAASAIAAGSNHSGGGLCEERNGSEIPINAIGHNDGFVKPGTVMRATPLTPKGTSSNQIHFVPGGSCQKFSYKNRFTQQSMQTRSSQVQPDFIGADQLCNAAPASKAPPDLGITDTKELTSNYPEKNDLHPLVTVISTTSTSADDAPFSLTRRSSSSSQNRNYISDFRVRRTSAPGTQIEAIAPYQHTVVDDVLQEPISHSVVASWQEFFRSKVSSVDEKEIVLLGNLDQECQQIGNQMVGISHPRGLLDYMTRERKRLKPLCRELKKASEQRASAIKKHQHALEKTSREFSPKFNTFRETYCEILKRLWHDENCARQQNKKLRLLPPVETMLVDGSHTSLGHQIDYNLNSLLCADIIWRPKKQENIQPEKIGQFDDNAFAHALKIAGALWPKISVGNIPIQNTAESAPDDESYETNFSVFLETLNRQSRNATKLALQELVVNHGLSQRKFLLHLMDNQIYMAPTAFIHDSVNLIEAEPSSWFCDVAHAENFVQFPAMFVSQFGDHFRMELERFQI